MIDFIKQFFLTNMVLAIIATLVFAVLRINYLHKNAKKFDTHEKLIWAFAFYFFSLMSLAVFRVSAFLHIIWVLRTTTFIPLLPAIKESCASFALFMYDVVGNIVAFIPFGLLLPLISDKFRSLGMVFKWSLICTVSIETLQFILSTGHTDINDVIFNVIGGVVGYYIYRWLLRRNFLQR